MKKDLKNLNELSRLLTLVKSGVYYSVKKESYNLNFVIDDFCYLLRSFRGNYKFCLARCANCYNFECYTYDNFLVCSIKIYFDITPSHLYSIIHNVVVNINKTIDKRLILTT